MKLGELKDLLDEWDPSMEVKIRINAEQGEDSDPSDMLFGEFEGEYCEVTDERSVLVENGNVVIIGDWCP